MTHQRTLIRKRVGVVLQPLESDGFHVFTSRTYRIDESQFPALSIYCSDEEVEPDSITKGPSGLIQLELNIDCFVSPSSDADADTVLASIQGLMTQERRSSVSGGLPELTTAFYYMGLGEVDYEASEDSQVTQTIKYLIQYEQQL